MRFFVPLLAFGVACAAPALTFADERFTIAAYNIENAFDVFDSPYTDDEEMEVKQRWQLESIAKAVRKLDADVVAFAEVENEHVLQAMVDAFLPDAGYKHVVVSPTNSDRGINLGIISRVPIKRIASHRFREFPQEGREMPSRFARDFPQFTLQVTPQNEVELFVVHFKSKRDSEGDPNSNAWRLAETREAKRVLDEVLEDSEQDLIAVVGDFNDEPGTPPIQTFTGDLGFVDVLSQQLSGEARISYMREPYRSAIDHIMVSPKLAQRLLPSSAMIIHEPELNKGSDHAPVAASFDLSK